MQLPSPKVCYQALQSRDSRFDGRIFVGVSSTGIYCRPICPARTPKFEHCTFFGTAAAAQEAGFRPCLRCRPEIAPHLASWRGTSNTVSRALALIDEGALDGADNTIEKLASSSADTAGSFCQTTHSRHDDVHDHNRSGSGFWQLEAF